MTPFSRTVMIPIQLLQCSHRCLPGGKDNFSVLRYQHVGINIRNMSGEVLKGLYDPLSRVMTRARRVRVVILDKSINPWHEAGILQEYVVLVLDLWTAVVSPR